jgi:hypothetical protein
VGVGGRHPVRRLLRDEVGRDQPRPAGRRQVARERVDAVPLDEVPVRHDQRRYARVDRRLDRPEHVRRPYAAGQRDLTGTLDHRPVHDRVAVREADLDEIDPRAGQGPDRRDAPVDGGEAGRQVSDQRGPALGADLVEDDGDAAPLGSPRGSALIHRRAPCPWRGRRS